MIIGDVGRSTSFEPDRTVCIPASRLSDALIGSHVGPYRIIGQLGEGGMGLVFLGDRDDHQFNKRVAIKVLKHAEDWSAAQRRFQLEREVLAAFDHPAIVRLLDAGLTANGMPCVITEYVEGVPLDQYCAKNLPAIAGRLRLFLEVCSAVHYAHQRLVVHCDIKPVNILVTPEGRPKLLDFGIGKLLQGQPETRIESAGGPLTLGHASPEQLLGRPVTTATDIYALGLTLYEILTGRRPHPSSNIAELVYKVTCTDPELPSEASHNPKLGGDLDAVVLKAMARDPAARYAGVAELADDISRHLNSLPVSVLSGSTRYRVSKFVLRNRRIAIPAFLGIVLLIGALVAAAFAGVVARRQQARAERRFEEVHQLVNVILFELYDAASKIPGATPLQEQMVKRSTEYLDRLSAEARGNLPLALDVIDAYIKFGDIQGNPYQPNLGDTAAALASYQKALNIASGLAKKYPANTQLQHSAAKAHQEMADVLVMLGRSKEGLDHVRQAVSIFEKLAKNDPKNIEATMDLASCLEGLGDQLGHPGLISLGDEQGAVIAYNKSLENWQAALSQNAGNVRVRRASAVLLMKIADIEDDRGKPLDALKMYRQASAAAQSLPSDPKSRRVVSMLERKLGASLGAVGNREEAEQHLFRALSESEATSAADPLNARARLDVAVCWNTLGDFYDTTGNTSHALTSFAKTTDLLEALARSDPSNTRYPTQLSDVLLHTGELLYKSGHKPEAAHQTQRGLEVIRRLADAPNASPGTLNQASADFRTCVPESLRDARLAALYKNRARK